MSRIATAPVFDRTVTATVPHPDIPPALDRACLAAKTAADNKGSDVRVLDLRGLTPMFDFFVLSTGNSRRQVHTIVEETDAAMRSVGDARLAVEGYDSSKWVVQDYGDVVAHVFDADTRDYYKLEDVWADAKVIDWESELFDIANEDGDEPDADEVGEDDPELHADREPDPA